MVGTQLEAKNNVLLLSYPRSGTHIMSIIIRNLMFRQTTITPTSYSKVSDNYLNVHSMGMYKAKQNASFNSDYVLDVKKDYLIFLVRNYRECMLRHFDEDAGKVIEHLQDDSKSHFATKFFENLELYDNWPSNRKLLVYYEDLMLSQEKEVKRIANFLQTDEDTLNLLLESLEKQREGSLRLYIKRYGDRKEGSKGLDILSHSRNIPHKHLVKMDKIAKRRARHLYAKYLKRYELKKPISSLK